MPVPNVDFRDVYPLALQNYFPFQSGGNATLGRTRAALQNARYGLGAAKFMCVGDSTTQGYRSNATINLTRLNGYPPKMAGLLKNAGIPTSYDSIFGNGSNNSADAFNKYDNRWSSLNGTVTSNGFLSLGGGMLVMTGTETLSFTPGSGVLADRADIYSRQITTGASSFNANQGGGSNTLISSTTASNALLKNTISYASTAAPIINMAWASGSVAIDGVDVYSSTAPVVRVLNAGIFAAKSADWADTSTGFSPLNSVAVAQPALCIVDLGINDWVNGVSVATYQSNMQTIVSTLLASCDVILKTPVPSHTSIATPQTQLQYVQAAEAVAIASGVPYLGGYERFVSYVAANANGLMGDLEHASAIGYGDIAQMVVNGLMAA